LGNNFALERNKLILLALPDITNVKK